MWASTENLGAWPWCASVSDEALSAQNCAPLTEAAIGLEIFKPFNASQSPPAAMTTTLPIVCVETSGLHARVGVGRARAIWSGTAAIIPGV